MNGILCLLYVVVRLTLNYKTKHGIRNGG